MHKVLLIGAGSICQAHIAAFNALRPRCELVGIVGNGRPDSAIKQIAAAGLENCKAYGDYKLAIAETGCDVVSIITPPGSHREIACYAMEHGCHVLLEKPMAPSLQECDAILETARRTGKKLSVVAQSRFLAPIWRTKQLLDSGAAGRLLFTQVNSNWYRGLSYYDLAWRGCWATEGGGTTYNQAIHHLDLLAWMSGMPRTITAVIGNLEHTNSEEEDISLAMMRFDNGSMAQFCANLLSHGQEQTLNFSCEKAYLKLPHGINADATQENGFPHADPEAQKALEDAYAAIPAPRYEGHTGLADDLLCAIDEDRSPIADGQAGRNAMELIMAIYKSASEGVTVTLPIANDDDFYTSAGMAKHMPKFYKKTGFLDHFENNTIVLASAGMK